MNFWKKLFGVQNPPAPGGASDEQFQKVIDATWDRDLKEVEKLLHCHPALAFSKGKTGMTLLHFAAGFGHTGVAELLLANKADVNAMDNDGATPLHIAAVGGQGKLVKLLLAHNAELSDFDAAACGFLDKVQTALKTNPSLVFVRDHHGKTVLHVAARHEDCEMMELLLLHGADVNARDRIGQTPLHEMGAARPVELLLAHNAEVNPRDKDGMTPFHFAVLWSKHEVMQLLLAHHAEVNAADNYGMTPLHYAARGGLNNASMELLLTHKADVNARDRRGVTPLRYAVRGEHQDTVNRLRQHGAHEKTGNVPGWIRWCERRD